MENKNNVQIQKTGAWEKPRPQKNVHLLQLLGRINRRDEYVLDSETAEALLALPKFEIEEENRIEGFGGYINFESQTDGGVPVFFRVETEKIKNGHSSSGQRAVLFLQEEADEIGGLLTFTYLMPLAVFESSDEETFLAELYQHFNIGENTGRGHSSALLDERIKRRAVIRRSVEIEAERLSRTAQLQIDRILAAQTSASSGCTQFKKEFDSLRQTAKRFVRAGKPNYCQSQIQLVQHIIQNRNLQEDKELQPIAEIAEKCEQQIEAAAQKVLSNEAAVDNSRGTEHAVIQCENRGDSASAPLSNSRRAIIAKLPALEQTTITNSRLDFGRLISVVKSNKGTGTRREVLTKLPKDSLQKREQWKREYDKKSKPITEIMKAEQEIEDKEIIPVAVPDEESETNISPAPDTNRQIERIVTEGLEKHIYKKEERKATLTITPKLPQQKNSEDRILKN